MSHLYMPAIANAPTMPVMGEGQTNLPFTLALYSLMAHDPGQKRASLVVNKKLTIAAQLHCEDMAERNYFSHETPDGVWPNKRVRDGGYKLPSTWPDDVNWVESIAAGYETPAIAWAAWMISPSHKKHLLGQDAFYAAETNVGIGFYELPGSTYRWYWTVVTAPPEAA
jgi:uncharacterized protein YkwD